MASRGGQKARACPPRGFARIAKEADASAATVGRTPPAATRGAGTPVSGSSKAAASKKDARNEERAIDDSTSRRLVRSSGDRVSDLDESSRKKQKSGSSVTTDRTSERRDLISSPSGTLVTHGTMSHLVSSPSTQGKSDPKTSSYLGCHKPTLSTYDSHRFVGRSNDVHRFHLSDTCRDTTKLPDRYVRKAMEAIPRALSTTLDGEIMAQSLEDNVIQAMMNAVNSVSGLNRVIDLLDARNEEMLELRKQLDEAKKEVVKERELSMETSRLASSRAQHAEDAAKKAQESEKKVLDMLEAKSSEINTLKGELKSVKLAKDQGEKKQVEKDGEIVELKAALEEAKSKAAQLEAATSVRTDEEKDKDWDDASTQGYYMSFAEGIRTVYKLGPNGEIALKALIKELYEFIVINPPTPGIAIPILDLADFGVDLSRFDSSATLTMPKMMYFHATPGPEGAVQDVIGDDEQQIDALGDLTSDPPTTDASTLGGEQPDVPTALNSAMHDARGD